MPEWLKNAVAYEVYPQTFLDTNGDGLDIRNLCLRKNRIRH